MSVDGRELIHLRARVQVLEAEITEKDEFIDAAFEVHPNLDLDIAANNLGYYVTTGRRKQPKALPEEEIMNILGDDSL